MITIRFNNKGESGAIPITADNLNLLIDQINADNEKILELITKTQHITADDNGTHFKSGVYANGNELVADDDYKDPSVTKTINLESEKSDDEKN